MRRMLISVLPALLLAGCAHVPLGTMWAMRDFSPRTLAAADPAAVRVAMQTPDALALEPGGHRLVMDLQTEGDVVPPFHVDVALEVETSLRDSGPLEGRTGAHWHVLKLEASGIDAVRTLRDHLAKVPEGTKGSFQLAVKPAFGPAAGDWTRRLVCGEPVGEFSAAIRMAPDQDWLVLFEEWPLELTRREIEAMAEAARAEGKPDPRAGVDCKAAR